MNKEDLIEIIAKHIARNWYASLGYGKDELVITKACDDLDWLLGPLDITTEDIINEINK